MTTKTTLMVLTVITGLTAQTYPAYTDPVEATALQRAATRTAVNNLMATVDTYPTQEEIRLGKADDGSLIYFGAPPGSPSHVNNAPSNATNPEKAALFLQNNALAFGVARLSPLPRAAPKPKQGAPPFGSSKPTPDCPYSAVNPSCKWNLAA